MYGNSVGEVRSEARFRFQIARRILAYILDRVEEGKFSLKKLPSSAVPAKGVATSQSGVVCSWETALWGDLVSGPSEKRLFLSPSSWLVCGSH